MRKLRFANIRKLCSTVGMFPFLTVLPLAAFGIAYAQSSAVPSPAQKKPFIIEQSDITDGKRDPRSRFYLMFGEARENCTAWRFETSALTNGYAVFELKDPSDKKAVLKLAASEQHLELVLGDANCNYRITIERVK